MDARRLASSVCFRMATFTGQMKNIPAQSHMGLPPGPETHTYIQTYKQTYKHRKQKTSRWLRPYVFNIGQKLIWFL